MYVCLCLPAVTTGHQLVHQLRLLSTWSSLDPRLASCTTLTTWLSRRNACGREATDEPAARLRNRYPHPAHCLMVPLLPPPPPLSLPSVASAHCLSLVKSWFPPTLRCAALRLAIRLRIPLPGTPRAPRMRGDSCSATHPCKTMTSSSLPTLVCLSSTSTPSTWPRRTGEWCRLTSPCFDSAWPSAASSLVSLRAHTRRPATLLCC